MFAAVDNKKADDKLQQVEKTKLNKFLIHKNMEEIKLRSKEIQVVTNQTRDEPTVISCLQLKGHQTKALKLIFSSKNKGKKNKKKGLCYSTYKIKLFISFGFQHFNRCHLVFEVYYFFLPPVNL